MTEPKRDFTDDHIRGIAFDAAKEEITAHVNSCPWGKKLLRVTYGIAGAVVVLGILGVTNLKSLMDLTDRQAAGKIDVDREAARVLAREAVQDYLRQQNDPNGPPLTRNPAPGRVPAMP